MTEDQATGMLVGLAVGDALGTYLEFGPSREPEIIFGIILKEGPSDCQQVHGPMTPAWPWQSLMLWICAMVSSMVT